MNAIRKEKKLSETLPAPQQEKASLVLDRLYGDPLIDTNKVKHITQLSGHKNAQNLISKFIEMGILVDSNPEAKRNKQFVFQPYIALLDKDFS